MVKDNKIFAVKFQLFRIEKLFSKDAKKLYKKAEKNYKRVTKRIYTKNLRVL